MVEVKQAENNSTSAIQIPKDEKSPKINTDLNVYYHTNRECYTGYTIYKNNFQSLKLSTAKTSINAHSIINSKARVRYSTNLLEAKNYSCLSPGEERFTLKVIESSRIVELKIREKKLLKQTRNFKLLRAYRFISCSKHQLSYHNSIYYKDRVQHSINLFNTKSSSSKPFRSEKMTARKLFQRQNRGQ